VARDVIAWMTAYERLWRTEGTAHVAALFAEDATYLVSPWAEPLRGLEQISEMWESERVGPDEEFTMSFGVVAMDGGVVVVRVDVEYAATGNSWRNLWILRFAPDGRCSWFEEWPFAPDRPDGHD
jgi:ketosteroid isomerase-like protein